MNRRIISVVALCSGLLAVASLVPAAHAGNVAWGISVGGPGFSVSTGQPALYGAPFSPWARPWLRPALRPVIVPPVAFVPPPVAFPFYAPAPVVLARPFAYVRRPVVRTYWRY